MNVPAERAVPVFVDNQDGNTLQAAITSHLRDLRNSAAAAEELSVATAYFNPEGLQLLAEELEHLGRIRLLLGVEPVPEVRRRRRGPFDPAEPEYTRLSIAEAKGALRAAFRADRDRMPFDLATNTAIVNLLGFLRSGKVEARLYEQQFLHAKAFIFRGPERGVLSGSSNLTRAGLATNLELNLGNYRDPLLARVEAWYEQLWRHAGPIDLAAIYAELLQEFPPYLVYLAVLWQLYGQELHQEEEAGGDLRLTTFQRHGVWRAKRILETYGGVVIADGVGLGKTFTAGELVRQYRERRQRVLLIRPAALKSTWEGFLNRHQLLVEALSYEALAADKQLGGDSDHLKNPLDDYALVVVDEAHNYRNPDSPQRAGVLRRILAGRRRDLVLLTATPVNNSLWDLYHILRYFLKQDAALADKGILSIHDRFREAMRVDPFDLHPDMLYQVIDATTVKRTRRFVKKYYQNDRIPGPDGALVPIVFPTPVPVTVKYDLDEVLPGFFARLSDAIMPAHDAPLLTLARYEPERFLAGQQQVPGNNALVGLIRSAMLKRFESSGHAFVMTLGRMRREHEAFLHALARGVVLRTEFLREISAADEDVDLDSVLDDFAERADSARDYDVRELRAAVQSDLELLSEFHDRVAAVPDDQSPKLRALIDALATIASEAHREAADPQDERRRRKVLIFSAYADTIDWLARALETRLHDGNGLAAFAARMAVATGRHGGAVRAREEAVYGFAPVSSQAPPGSREDRFDLLLSTDVLAEGVNLQECRHVINFDMPWNPMRLVQRHGRVDRIGSPHLRVFLRTFFPDRRLDDMLQLEERVLRKLAQAAASVGLEEPPIERAARGLQDFAETKEEIEKLFEEDPSLFERGGTDSAAQTGEEYRQELRRGLERFGDEIRHLPWKAGSGMAKGSKPGHFFCARIDQRVYLRFVPLNGLQEDVVSETGTCLRLIECTNETPRVLSAAMAQAAFHAWELAKRSVFDAWMYETDPANLQPKIPRLNREVAAFLRDHPVADMDASRVERALEAVEAPWSRREENQLRLAFSAHAQSNQARAKAVVEEIERIGVEPVSVPAPLPPIDEGDIHLVCWLGIVAQP